MTLSARAGVERNAKMPPSVPCSEGTQGGVPWARTVGAGTVAHTRAPHSVRAPLRYTTPTLLSRPPQKRVWDARVHETRSLLVRFTHARRVYAQAYPEVGHATVSEREVRIARGAGARRGRRPQPQSRCRRW